jgi:hypothetical protein
MLSFFQTDIFHLAFWQEAVVCTVVRTGSFPSIDSKITGRPTAHDGLHRGAHPLVLGQGLSRLVLLKQKN